MYKMHKIPDVGKKAVIRKSRKTRRLPNLMGLATLKIYVGSLDTPGSLSIVLQSLYLRCLHRNGQVIEVM